jgi:hypothetical protein
MTMILPKSAAARWAVDAGDELLEGETLVGELTGVQDGLPVVSGEGEQAFRVALTAAVKADAKAVRLADYEKRLKAEDDAKAERK